MVVHAGHTALFILLWTDGHCVVLGAMVRAASLDSIRLLPRGNGERPVTSPAQDGSAHCSTFWPSLGLNIVISTKNLE
jgi:hypothetical protein